MKIILGAFLILAVTVQGQTKTGKGTGIYDSPVISDWETLVQSDYTIQYPSNWEINQSGYMGTNVILFSALESKEDKFRENVNVFIQDLIGRNIDLDEYTKISEAQIKKIATDSTMVESKRIKNRSGAFHKMIYSAEQGIYHLKFEQYYMIIGNFAYVVTFTAEQSKFESFRATGEKILNSFELKR